MSSNVKYILTLTATLAISVVFVLLLSTFIPNLSISDDTIEGIAWLLITCSFLGFLPAAFIFGKGRKYDHSFREIYGTVYLTVLGDVLALGLLASIYGNVSLFSIVACAIVIYHFVSRRASTEHKMTPHFGQRGADDEMKRELALGHTCDLYQCVLMLSIYIITDHPIWILGIILFFFQYFIGVRLHLIFNNIPETYGSTLVLLLFMAILVWPFLAWFGEIQRYNVFFNIDIVIIAGLVGQFFAAFYKGKAKFDFKWINLEGYLVLFLFVISGAIGLIVTPNKLNVSNTYMLFGNPGAKNLVSYSIVLIFVSTLVNALVAIFVNITKKHK